MTELRVWTYPDVDGARRLERRMSDGSVGDIVVTDGAIVTWMPGRASPQVRELQGAARTDSLGVGFWGMLFGIVVSGPDLAGLTGHPTRALDGSLTGVGVDGEVLAELRRALLPGRSAFAVICAEEVATVIEDGSRAEARILRAREEVAPASTRRRLTADQEDALRRVFCG
ncbi:MAG: DUF1269 domain-containing protein [Nocardioides sp.]